MTKDKTLKELKSFVQISSKINSQFNNEDALFLVFLQEMMHFLNCDDSVYVSLNKATNKLECKAAAGNVLSKYKGKFFEGNSVALRCLESENSINLKESVRGENYSIVSSNFPDLKIDTMLAVLIKDSSRAYGVAEFFNKRNLDSFTDEDLQIVEIFSSSLISSIKNFEKFNQINSENKTFKDKVSGNFDYKFHSFKFKSQNTKDLLEEVKIAAAGNSTILITGESGVGKEIFAEQIYLNSSRKNFPFIRVNCASLSSTLIESELFGHVKGSFTGADCDRIGRFEAADGGVLFLDEIGELPVELQPKLLRAIQERKFEKVGSSKTICVDVRIIAATNKNLEKLVEDGKFREDLFYRLNVYNLRIPPLRERQEDIDVLADYFLEKYSEQANKFFKGFSSSAKNLLHSYKWPGNIRELENAIARSVIVGKNEYITSEDFRLEVGELTNSVKFAEQNVEKIIELNKNKTLKSALDNFKKAYVTRILEENDWNQTKAAKILDIQRTYVSRLMNELHIREKMGE